MGMGGTSGNGTQKVRFPLEFYFLNLVNQNSADIGKPKCLSGNVIT